MKKLHTFEEFSLNEASLTEDEKKRIDDAAKFKPGDTVVLKNQSIDVRWKAKTDARFKNGKLSAYGTKEVGALKIKGISYADCYVSTSSNDVGVTYLLEYSGGKPSRYGWDQVDGEFFMLVHENYLRAHNEENTLKNLAELLAKEFGKIMGAKTCKISTSSSKEFESVKYPIFVVEMNNFTHQSNTYYNKGESHRLWNIVLGEFFEEDQAIQFAKEQKKVYNSFRAKCLTSFVGSVPKVEIEIKTSELILYKEDLIRYAEKKIDMKKFIEDHRGTSVSNDLGIL
jgi:hypothetical protein